MRWAPDRVCFATVMSLTAAFYCLVQAGCGASDSSGRFVPLPLPFHSYNVYDIGVVDFNGDGNLDIFTANCSVPMNLLENDGKAHFKQRRTEMGLDHCANIPGFGVWGAVPQMNAPGYYVFFVGRYLLIAARARVGEGGSGSDQKAIKRVDIQTGLCYKLVRVAEGGRRPRLTSQ